MVDHSLKRRAFHKFHGLGNDFVLFDAREMPLDLKRQQAELIANRHLGVGADQVLTLTTSEIADAALRFQNIDGRDAEACGNATRCVAQFLFDERSRRRIDIETPAGVISAVRTNSRRICVDMGKPKFGWSDIPLAQAVDTEHLPLSRKLDGRLVVADGAAVSIGNPHAVFFVESIADAPIEAIGQSLETDPLFPDGANIGFAEVRGRNEIRLRVWERSVGLTLACATGSCAAVVVGCRRGLLDRQVVVCLDGGQLEVEWPEKGGNLLVSGPVMHVFDGMLSERFAEDLTAFVP